MTEIVISNNKAEKKQLAKLEKRIEANTKAAWRENGLIMLHIRNSGLYKAGYSEIEKDSDGTIRKWTFERYLEKRWDIKKSHGYRLLAGVELVQKLAYCTENDSDEMSPIGDKNPIVFPENEAQVRPLIECLDHDGERLHVWQEVAQSGEKITAALVQRKVDEFKASGQVVEDVEIKLPEVVVPNKVHVAKNSGENEWYTPAKHIELARAVMGGIDCDPATSEIANRTVQATTIYTADDDGRDKTWRGRVWCNPPYAQPLMGDFAEAVAAKYESGEIEQACILVNNATETQWFQRMLGAASAVCFPKSRIKFLDPQGNPGAPLQGQAIVYMGESVQAFKDAFSVEGKVLTA